MRSIRTHFLALTIAVLTAGFLALPLVVASQDAPPAATLREIAVAALPVEARDTLALIKKGGPYPYQRDGAVFGNYERRLPVRNRGYYREFTVPTPGSNNRGARRFVVSKEGEYYYTDDHYRSFKRVRE